MNPRDDANVHGSTPHVLVGLLGWSNKRSGVEFYRWDDKIIPRHGSEWGDLLAENEAIAQAEGSPVIVVALPRATTPEQVQEIAARVHKAASSRAAVGHGGECMAADDASAYDFEGLREKANRRGRIDREPGDYAYALAGWNDVIACLDEINRLRGLVEMAATPGKWDDFLAEIGGDNGR